MVTGGVPLSLPLADGRSGSPEGRLEILRVLRRDLVRVGQDPVRQAEEWQFNIQFLHTDPPTIKFAARHVAIPAHLWREADRYFADMRTILGREGDGDEIVDEAVVEEVEVETVIEIDPPVEGTDASSPEESTAETLGDLLDGP